MQQVRIRAPIRYVGVAVAHGDGRCVIASHPSYPGQDITQVERPVKIQKIRSIAKEMGVNSARMNKGQIIRAIQDAEGNFPCFGTGRDGYCDREDCIWKEDCLPRE